MIWLTTKKKKQHPKSVCLAFPRGKMISEKIPRGACMREELDISSKLVDKDIIRSVRK